MDEYFNAFYGIVKETQDSSGYTLPVDLESYIVMLLSHHVDKVHWLPKKSFAELYLTLPKERLPAKELGDTCLFLTGVFPQFAISRNSIKYYQDIGSNSYDIVNELFPGDLFSQLSKHFVFLSEFIEFTLHSSKNEITIN